MPLTFVSSYKILDMIFERILEENKVKVPWSFKEKIKIISDRKLNYPPLFQFKSYIKEYLFEIYKNLRKFRNEIVHRNRYSILDNKLKIESTENSKSYFIEID
jgi:hypothetical protein